MMLRAEHSEDQRAEVNCGPRSEVMTAGTPNLEIHPWSRAAEQSAAVVLARGRASNHLVERSITVNRWVNPLEEGKGPTRSTWMWEKRRCGTGRGSGGRRTWRSTLARWQARHSRTHSVTALAMPSQTNRADTNRLVARAPAWAIPWMAEKTV